MPQIELFCYRKELLKALISASSLSPNFGAHVGTQGSHGGQPTTLPAELGMQGLFQYLERGFAPGQHEARRSEDFAKQNDACPPSEAATGSCSQALLSLSNHVSLWGSGEGSSYVIIESIEILYFLVPKQWS